MLKRLLILLIPAVFSLSSCHVLYPSIMFKGTPTDSTTVFSTTAPPEYKIAPNDIVQFSLYTNDGNKLIDVGQMNTSVGQTGQSFLVDIDGNMRLPVLGLIHIAGLTVRETEKMLEEKFSKYYVNPFVLAKVLNRRVIIFPGSAGTASVITLQNENTTLLEALAQVGGIPSSGKAHRIKLIRRTNDSIQTQMIDLSTAKNLALSNIVMQANDIIYVQPTAKLSTGILAEIGPPLGLITSFLLAVTLYKQFTK